MTDRRLFIHAPNIHQGGGKVLLEAAVFSGFSACDITLVVDARMVFTQSVPDNIHIKTVEPSVSERFRAEKWLKAQVQKDDVVLCLGNLPPLFRLASRTSVFLQNRLLITNDKLSDFPLRTRLRLAIERLWLKRKVGHVDEFIVQTPTMKSSLLSSGIATNGQVKVFPFAEGIDEQKIASQGRADAEYAARDQKFIYVASGEPHKNHMRLIEAWEILASEGVFPSLTLTLGPGSNADLQKMIAGKVASHGLKIEDRGSLEKEQISELYSAASALIYPSLLESFGLPLIEAKGAGLPIIASELDYVRDIVVPEQTFDPNSAISIARAIKRFLGLANPPLRIRSGKEFLDDVWLAGT